MAEATDPDALIAELNGQLAAAAVDRATEALALAAEAAEALADRDGYDVATVWWAAGTLSSAYNLLLPHTEQEPSELPAGLGALAQNPHRLTDLLQAAVDALDRAAREAQEPERIYALSRAADLAAKACRACINAKAAP